MGFSTSLKKEAVMPTVFHASESWMVYRCLSTIWNYFGTVTFRYLNKGDLWICIIFILKDNIYSHEKMCQTVAVLGHISVQQEYLLYHLELISFSAPDFLSFILWMYSPGFWRGIAQKGLSQAWNIQARDKTNIDQVSAKVTIPALKGFLHTQWVFELMESTLHYQMQS